MATEMKSSPKLAKLSDLDLVQKVVNGEKRYFNEIVSRYENAIYQYALRMCGNPADAEDTLQEAFLNAFRALPNFRGDSKLLTWLFKITNNSCLMKRRKSKFAPDQELSLSDMTMETNIDKDTSFVSQTASPMKNVQNMEFQEKLQRILLELPKHYRKAFILADIQGFSGQEIADILGITVPTVKSRLHRARLFIREKLTQQLDLEVSV